MPALVEILVSLCAIAGAVFAVLGAIGLAKLPDFFCRLHGPTKVSTLGVGGIMLASLLYFSVRNGQIGLHETLLALFLFLTAPVSAHLLAKAALHRAARRDRADALHQNTGE